MSPLILKGAQIGDNEDDYDVPENGVVVGRIFLVPVAPQGQDVGERAQRRQRQARSTPL